MTNKLIAQGAEAKITLSGNKVIKQRLPKTYRLKELDERIRKLRTRSEFKMLEKASKVVPIPSDLNMNEELKEISMEFIDGKRLSHHLDSFTLKEQKEILKQIGTSVAKFHDVEIIHGDLTTSNILYKDKKAYFIDFGLGYQSKKVEDRAVDIHLLRQALEAKHFKNWQVLFDSFLLGYQHSKDSKKVIERFTAVEKRGRYKDKY